MGLGDLNLGNSFPSFSEQTETQHLYVSLSELMMEKIFYHPNFASLGVELDLVEQQAIEALLGDKSSDEFFVATLVSEISAAILPAHTSIRIELNDANSYEMSALLGGKCEPDEINPALGIRGVSRFASEFYRSTFALECQIIKQLRQQGVDVDIVVPCVRALSDAAKIIDLLAEQGLPRGLEGLKVLFACDTPSSVLLSERLLQYFDGLVIKVENLTQLTLGVDVNQEELAHLFDTQNEAVLKLVKEAIVAAKASKKPALVCTSSLDDAPLLVELLEEIGEVEVYPTI